MEQGNTATSKLFLTTIVENKDELDEKFDRCYSFLQNLISGLSDKEANDALNSAISKDVRSHDDISIGLLVVILAEPQNAAKSYRDLTLVSRDGMNLVLMHLSQLVVERFVRLLDVVRQQLLWLLREMIRNAVTGVDVLCWNLLRNVAGGDVSGRNLVLAESLLDTFTEYRAWLDKFPFLVASVVYTYLRLIEDHGGVHLITLRQKEVTFTVNLLREKFSECLIIGRDLVRLLQNVARIPEFDALWKDMFNAPRTLSPNFSGILQLLTTRTSRRFLQSRLTPDMEKKIVFLTSSVRFGLHKRYQDWFQRQYLATVESQSLRCDLIRFIVGVIHPTNELLCSDIIPRWAVIGWLLTTCTAPVAASNAKLALFYDWLFFDPEKDNIMNIEPAILVMFHSMRSHPAVTATLLDFLCRIIPNFCPTLTERVQAGIFASLRQILDKRVLQTLNPIFDNPKLDRELRVMVRVVFKEFCLPPLTDGKLEDFAGANPQIKDDSPMLEGPSIHGPSNNHEKEPAFSEDEETEEDDDDIPLAKVRLKEKSSPDDSKEEMSLLLEGDMRKAVEALNTEDKEAQCGAMERLVQVLIQEDQDEETTSTIATCVCSVLRDQIEAKILPEDVNEESLEDSIGRPLFVMFRNLVQLQDSNANRRHLLQLVIEMSNREHRIGYLLLYFLAACNLEPGKFSVYREYSKALDKDLEASLLSDLKICQEIEVLLFCWLVPEIYRQFSSIAVGHSALLRMLIESVDAKQMQSLICLVLQGKLLIFEKESFLKVLEDSLEWETFEQTCVWHLIEAHNIPIDDIVPLLPKIDYHRHAEALTSIILFLKQERPTVDLLKTLLVRTVKLNDQFVVSILMYWIQDYEDKLADLMAGLLNKHSGMSPNKRKRGGSAAGANKAGPGPPSLEQILGHLDQLRQYSKQSPHFFLLDSMQRALQQASAVCTDGQRKRFSDLLALAEDLAPRSSSAGVRGTRNKMASTVKNVRARNLLKDISDTTEDSSEEEEIIKPKQPKKRKKTNPVNSDSD